MSTPTACKINLFLDSDGVVANYGQALEESGAHTDDFKMMPGVYLWLPVMPGAKEAIAELKLLDDADYLRVWVLTKTPTGCPYAYTEKVLWYRKNFPWLEDRVILTHDKHLVGTESDFLLDDRPHKANANLFRGTFIVFDENAPEESWNKFMIEVCDRIESLNV